MIIQCFGCGGSRIRTFYHVHNFSSDSHVFDSKEKAENHISKVVPSIWENTVECPRCNICFGEKRYILLVNEEKIEVNCEICVS